MTDYFVDEGSGVDVEEMVQDIFGHRGLGLMGT